MSTDFHFGIPDCSSIRPSASVVTTFFRLHAVSIPSETSPRLSKQPPTRNYPVSSDFSDTSPSLSTFAVIFRLSPGAATPLAMVALRSAGASLERGAASDGSPPGATNSTGRASKRCVASTPIMEEPRTELCQLERTLGIRMERIQAIAICKRRVGFGVALIACHRLPSAEWFSSQENSCKRR